MAQEKRRIYTEVEATKYLCLAITTLRRLRCQRKISYHRSATGGVYFTQEDLDNYALANYYPADFEIQSRAELAALNSK